MTTETLVKKLNKEMGVLKGEMREIRKMILNAISDPEGAYRLSFIKKILTREREPATYRFTTKEDFLRQLDGKSKK